MGLMRGPCAIVKNNVSFEGGAAESGASFFSDPRPEIEVSCMFRPGIRMAGAKRKLNIRRGEKHLVRDTNGESENQGDPS